MGNSDDIGDAPTGNITIPFVGPGECVAAGMVLPIVGGILVGLRFYSRKRVSKSPIGPEEWLIAIAWIFTLVMGVSLTWGAADDAFGYVTPPTTPNLTPEQELYYTPHGNSLQQKLEYAIQISQCLAYGFIKMSMLFFYRRIFVPTRFQIFDIVLLSSLAIVIAWTITFTILSIFHCGTHFWAIWSSLEAQHAYCPIDFPVLEGLAISDIILDILIVLMPLPVIWSLHLTTSKKFMVSGIFLIGFTAIAASVVRLVVYVELFKTNGDPEEDPMLTITLAMYWSMVEGGLSLIAACLAPLGALNRKMLPTLARLRSAISLKSLRSKGSDESWQHREEGDGKGRQGEGREGLVYGSALARDTIDKELGLGRASARVEKGFAGLSKETEERENDGSVGSAGDVSHYARSGLSNGDARDVEMAHEAITYG